MWLLPFHAVLTQCLLAEPGNLKRQLGYSEKLKINYILYTLYSLCLFYVYRISDLPLESPEIYNRCT